MKPSHGKTAQRNFVVVARGLKKRFGKNLDKFVHNSHKGPKILQLSGDKIRGEIRRGGKIKSTTTISAFLHGYLL
jgi:hypothetical protein